MGPRHSVVKNLRRAKRQGMDEPLAQESGARVYMGALLACRRKRRIRVKLEPLNTIIQVGFDDCFMEIQAVTGFPER
jgi:uncharacterized protein YqgV (UPF0045/DUF77 family)